MTGKAIWLQLIPAGNMKNILVWLLATYTCRGHDKKCITHKKNALWLHSDKNTCKNRLVKHVKGDFFSLAPMNRHVKTILVLEIKSNKSAVSYGSTSTLQCNLEHGLSWLIRHFLSECTDNYTTNPTEHSTSKIFRPMSEIVLESSVESQQSMK